MRGLLLAEGGSCSALIVGCVGEEGSTSTAARGHNATLYAVVGVVGVVGVIDEMGVVEEVEGLRENQCICHYFSRSTLFTLDAPPPFSGTGTMQQATISSINMDRSKTHTDSTSSTLLPLRLREDGAIVVVSAVQPPPPTDAQRDLLLLSGLPGGQDSCTSSSQFSVISSSSAELASLLAAGYGRNRRLPAWQADVAENALLLDVTHSVHGSSMEQQQQQQQGNGAGIAAAATVVDLGELHASALLACSRIKLCWVAPAHSTRAADLPRHIQALMVQLPAASTTPPCYALLLPLLPAGCKATLEPAR